MPPDELKQGYFEFIKAYTNNFRGIEKPEDAPLPVQMAIEKLTVYGTQNATVQSESIADLSVTYRDLGESALPPDVISLLKPYRKVSF